MTISSKGGLAPKHVRLMHHCKNAQQRNTVTRLVSQHWRDVWGEHTAADKFETQNCASPHANWNCAATGEAGALPSNCPNESPSKLMKDRIQLNMSLGCFLVQTMPKILREDTNQRSDVCTIERPRDASNPGLAASAFLVEG